MPFQFPWLTNPNSSQPKPNPSQPKPKPNPNPNPSPNPNPFLPIHTHLASLLSSLQSRLPALPPWAHIPSPSPSSAVLRRAPSAPAALPDAEIEERLAGVPVYALANAAQEFVLVSARGGRGSEPPPALGLLCFRKEDADALLAQIDGDMREGSRVVPVALNKVFQLKSNGVALRFLPDSSQVANAIKVKVFFEKMTVHLMEDEGQYVDEGFPGVPVFQSRSLVLMSDNKKYRPIFFRKEDLDNSLVRASREQQKLNPALMMGETQVSALEDIIKSMKDGSTSKWDDVVFIPPGFDLATGTRPSPLNSK